MKMICKSCGDPVPCVVDLGNGSYDPDDFGCVMKNRKSDCKWEKLPKLTAEVFDREDCPAWAKYAMVGISGKVVVSDIAPLEAKEIMWVWECEPKQKVIPGECDNSDWQNSLIKRPEKKLPDWCKPGEWCFCLDDDGNDKYFRITRVDDRFIYGDNWNIDYHFAKQARLRPFNDAEMMELVGKIAKGDNGTIALVIGFRARDKKLMFGNLEFSSEELLRYKYIIDGKPSYVLEHLNKKGEWEK